MFNLDEEFVAQPDDKIVILVERDGTLMVRYTPNVSTDDMGMMMYSVFQGLNLYDEPPENNLKH